MRRVIIIKVLACGLLIANTAFAQIANVEGIGHVVLMTKGNETIQGSPYIFSDWISVELKKGTDESFLTRLNYNAFTGELEVYHELQRIIVDKPVFNEFRIPASGAVFRNGFIGIPGTKPSDFMQVLISKDNKALVKQFLCKKETFNNYGTLPVDRYVSSVRYHMVVDQNFEYQVTLSNKGVQQVSSKEDIPVPEKKIKSEEELIQFIKRKWFP